MPLALFYYSSFERSLKKLGPQQVQVVGNILEAITVYLNNKGNLIEARKLSPRFFFKKLREPYYEAGVENKVRIILKKDAGNFFAILAGNHDDIRRFLAGS